MKLIAAVLLAATVLVINPSEPAEAHTDWTSAFDACQLITVVHIEGPTGQNYNVIRNTDFVFLGHFWVGCTVYPAIYVNSPHDFVCFVWDRMGDHTLAFVGCPTPP